ncbi:MAG: hypothetical protein FJX25_15755 [Alphaproteobacteria bacterium]|nr:hypothetical protein [Alphaproteobacteria bacterium]
MVRVNLYRPVHVQTLASQKHRALLRSRKLLQEMAPAIESDIRDLLRDFGLKVRIISAGRFEARVRDLIKALPDLGEVFSVLLAGRCKLREAFSQLHRKVLGIVRKNAVCMRLMTTPGFDPGASRGHSGQPPREAEVVLKKHQCPWSCVC